MFIDNWLAALVFTIFALFSLVPSVGWLYESIKHANTLHELKEQKKENKDLYKRLQAAEDANYKTTFRAMLNEVSRDDG